MPDQGDPIWGPEERFAEAVEPGRPSGSPVDDDLVRDLEIAAMLRSLGPALSAGDDAKARIRARVMASLAVDGPPSNGGGSASGAQRDLQLAVTRLDEIQEMARESADPGLITSAFQDFDDATSEGSRLALSGTDKATTYADLSVWSTQQSARLAELRSALPAPTEPAADDAARLLDRVHRRAGALAARSSCAQVSSGAVDDLGPIPATGACTVRQTPNGGTAATSDPAARRGTESPSPQESTTRSSTQQDGSTDPAQVSGGQAGSPDDESGSTATTTQAPASSKNAGLPLPLPLPVNVPQLLPGKLLG